MEDGEGVQVGTCQDIHHHGQGVPGVDQGEDRREGLRKQEPRDRVRHQEAHGPGEEAGKSLALRTALKDMMRKKCSQFVG